MEYEAVMRGNQSKFLMQPHWVFDELAKCFDSALVGWQGWYLEAKEHHADPHQKRELRIQAWRDIHEEGRESDRLWLQFNVTKYKLKRDEFAKPDPKKAGCYKPARTIGDLGVGASLQGAFITGRLKDGLAGCAMANATTEFQFLKKPTQQGLEDVFNKMIFLKGDNYFVYFSDDSCLAKRGSDGEVHHYNVDISKCDASHTPALFEKLKKSVPAFAADDIQILIEQCTSDLKLQAPDDKRFNTKNKIVLRPREPSLYSGSTLTTLINNIANLCVGICLTECKETDPDLLAEAVLRCGYHVTIEECHQPQSIQFLKNSPTLDTNGVWRPLLNLGVLLRASGQCKGDLPGKGDWVERARRFQRSVLNGMYPTAHFPLIDSMKATSGAQTAIETVALRAILTDLSYKVCEQTEHYYFSSAEVYRRYSLLEHEIEELDEVLGSLGTGEYCRLPGTIRILHADYGLEAKLFAEL